MDASSLDQVIERYHSAAGEMMIGNPEPYKSLFSHGDDVTLANPFNPVARGWSRVAAIIDGAAGQFRDGEIVGFENVTKSRTAELAFIVEVERLKARVGSLREVVPFTLRTTTIFRPEGGAWKIVHRHADPITTLRPAESMVQR